MSLLVCVIAIFILIAISIYCERRKQRRLAAELAPRLDALIGRVNHIPIDKLQTEFQAMKTQYMQSLVTLTRHSSTGAGLDSATIEDLRIEQGDQEA
jgi:hypothetical protein